MAIVYAAMAGRELLECRKGIKHGDWLKWVEQHCEFSVDTADRYLGLYTQLKSKLSNSARVRNLIDDKSMSAESLVKLLDRPPSELMPGETETLLTDIRQATQGQTLRQLYFDFGLATAPKPTGGANHLHAFLSKHFPDHPEYLKMALRELPKEVQKAWQKHIVAEMPSESVKREAAQAAWRMIVRELRQEGLDKKSYSYLTRAELEEVHGALLDVKKAISEALK
jgi:hypothetical protein